MIKIGYVGVRENSRSVMRNPLLCPYKKCSAPTTVVVQLTYKYATTSNKDVS